MSKISDLASSRGIIHLVHFTSLTNLISILKSGFILPRSERDKTVESDPVMGDYTRSFDKYRYDGKCDYIDLSVQHPNVPLLNSKKKENPDLTRWVILLISTQVLDVDGVQFAQGNAAATWVKKAGLKTGPDGFETLFSRKTGNGRIREETLSPCYPTDIQAEVLFPGKINLHLVEAIAVRSEDDCGFVSAAIRVIKDTVKFCPEVKTCPELFNTTRM